MNDIIDDLLEEGKTITFENNSYRESHGVYGRVSSDFRAWNVKVEDYVATHYGNDSAPMKLLSNLNLMKIKGNHSDEFDEQHAIITGALKACKTIKPKKSSSAATGIQNSATDKHNVFIVHGHDDLAKVSVARYIEKLGFKPIILNEQASSGRTIIEKIEEYSNVGYGIVLYTPCDLGGKTDKTLQARARQNVVFEHGYLIGKIGRDNVCALVKGDIETPNDISGVVYVNMDDSNAWHIQIAKELKNSGYHVDMNLVFN